MRLTNGSSNKIFKLLAAAPGAALCLLILASAASAQNVRRQAPAPTTQTLPVIISRASDIPSESAINTEQSLPPQLETLEEKLDKFNARMKEMSARLKSVESNQKNEYDDQQKRLLLNLDILTKAEQRAETLRKQLYELVEKENTIKVRLEQLTINLLPENIERSSAFAGSLRPEEVREQREKSLKAEKNTLETLLAQIQSNRSNLEENVQKADLLVEKVRAKTEKEIDLVLTDEASIDN